MAFRIKDLMVSVLTRRVVAGAHIGADDPGCGSSDCGSTDSDPGCGSSDCGSTDSHPGCGSSDCGPTDVVGACMASHIDEGIINRGDPVELNRLKAQLQQLTAAVQLKEHDIAIQAAINNGVVEKLPASPVELESLEVRLREALNEVQLKRQQAIER